MQLNQVYELRAAATVIDESTRAGMVCKIGPAGNLVITSYGDTDALAFIYKCISKAWKDYDESMTYVCQTTAQMGIDKV